MIDIRNKWKKHYSIEIGDLTKETIIYIIEDKLNSEKFELKIDIRNLDDPNQIVDKYLSEKLSETRQKKINSLWN